MPGSILPLVRQRVDAVSALKWAILLGLIYAVTRNLSLILGLLTALLVTETIDILEVHPAVDERWVKVGLGGVLLALSCLWLWGELQEPTAARRLWVPILALGGSLWVLLDARADFVQGRRFDGRRFHTEPDDEPSASDVMVLSQHAQLIANSVREGPKTVGELAADCDLTESRVREAIEIAGEDGTIYPVDPDADDPRYALDEGKMGASGVGRLAAGGVSSVLRRLARPFVDQF
ncbi:MAG: hypothetical protein U9O06_01970 [Euryarchaeota archaeon]|nr:hypothetical protein [Euryarchaeota archaeon]